MKKLLGIFLLIFLFFAIFSISAPKNSAYAQTCSGSKSYTRTAYACKPPDLTHSTYWCQSFIQSLTATCSQSSISCRACELLDQYCSSDSSGCLISNSLIAGEDSCSTGSLPSTCSTSTPTPAPTTSTACTTTNCTGHASYQCTAYSTTGGTCCDFTYRCDSTNTSCISACHAGVAVSNCGGCCSTGTWNGSTCVVSPTPTPTATPVGATPPPCDNATCNAGYAVLCYFCNSTTNSCQAYSPQDPACTGGSTPAPTTAPPPPVCSPSYNEQIAPVNKYSGGSLTTWGATANIVVSATGSGNFYLNMNNNSCSYATINSVDVAFPNFYTSTTYPTYTASGNYCATTTTSRLACPDATTQCTNAGSTTCTVKSYTDSNTRTSCRTSTGQSGTTYSSSCTVQGTLSTTYGAVTTPSLNSCSGLPGTSTTCGVKGNNVPPGLYGAKANSTNSVPNKSFDLNVYVVNPQEINYTCSLVSGRTNISLKFKDFGGTYYCASSDSRSLGCANGTGNGTSTDTIIVSSLSNGIYNINVIGWKNIGTSGTPNWVLIGGLAEALNINVNNGVCTVAPPPTPIPTPTPTPPPGSNSISGNVFVDANKNLLLDSGEFGYSAGTSTINIYQGSLVSGTPYQTVTTNTGIFTSGNVLPVGTYTVSYSGLPTGWQMTIPPGIPPQFTVVIGPGCSVGASNSATCSSNNIINLNYGITNSIPWCQFSGGGNVGGDGGLTCNCTGSGCIVPSPTPPSGGGNGDTCIYDVDCTTGLTCNTSGSSCTCSVGTTPGTCTTGTGGAGGGNTGGGTGGTGGGGGGFTDVIPSTALAACGGAYASVPGNTSTTPGLIFTGNGSAYFGQGSASLNNWLVGGTNYPESFGPIAQGGFVKTSYAYLQSIAKQASITPVDLNSDTSFCNGGGLVNCTLSSTLPHGIYVANGDLTLTGSGTPASYTFPSNQGYIILVHGNLTIQTRLHVPVGSTALFSASGNILVDKSVGEQNYQSSNPDIEGVFSADQSFIINGQNDCTIGPDIKLNIAGSVITNAALNGGAFINQRDLCANNLYCPVFTIQLRPDFILNAPNFIKKTNSTWQEVAP